MKKLEVLSHLNQIREAREARSKAVQDLSIAISEMMRLLIHEGLAQFMSPEQIASESGHPAKYVRDLMRTMDLNPKSGRTVLSRKAAEALNTNAALMGIDPSDFDLTSPLAYLPMGSVLKRELTDARTSQVDEADVSGNRTLREGVWCTNCEFVEDQEDCPEEFAQCRSCGCSPIDHVFVTVEMKR